MADRAEIKLTLDARQARGEAQRARRRLQENERRVQTQLRNDRRIRGAQAQTARGAAQLGRPSRGGALLAGAVAGRAAVAGGIARAGAAAGVALAAFEGVTEATALATEVITETLVRPIVDKVLQEVLPETLPDLVQGQIADRVEFAIQARFKDLIDDFRRVTRFEAITKQLARTQFIDIAAGFERAGDGFTLSQAVNLSENFVRGSERKSFLRRMETSRTTNALSKATKRAIINAFGE